MNKQSELSEKRAGIYWWFSTLFIRELNDQQLAALTGKSGIEFLDAFASEGMATEVDALTVALDRLGSNGDLQLELAADYAQTFLRDEKSSALPYASLYLSRDGLLYQREQKEMSELLQQEGLAVDNSLGEPADHIAVQLDYLGNLVLRGVDASCSNDLRNSAEKQLEFIDAHLLNWTPQFVGKCLDVRDALFYPALCRLFLAYLRQEREFLVAEAA